VEVVVKNQALEKVLSESLSAYCERYPEHWEALISLVKDEAESLVKPSGLSADGTLLTYCKLPAHLYAAIKYVCRKHCGIEDVWRDQLTYQLICRIASDLHIKKRPSKRLYLKLDF
jgi:hypothetical protein